MLDAWRGQWGDRLRQLVVLPGAARRATNGVEARMLRPNKVDFTANRLK